MAEQAFELKVSKNMRVIKNGTKVLVYNAFSGTGMIGHVDMLKLIEGIQQGKSLQKLKVQYPQPDMESIISALLEKRLIVKKDLLEKNTPLLTYEKSKIQNGYLVNKLRLNVSQACNMTCTYCYVDQKNINSVEAMMSWSVAKTAIDKFFALLKRHDHKFCVIRFFGGEPLLNWPIIKLCLEYIQKERQDISVSLLINTNGTVFTKKIAKTLLEHQVGIAVSLDGAEKEHDRFRIFSSGKPSYQIIVGHIEKYLQTGCTLGIETTLGDHNMLGLKLLINQISLWNETYKISIPLSFQNLTIVKKTNIDTTPVREKTKRLMALLDHAAHKKVKADTGMVHFSVNALKGQRHIGKYCRATGGELCIYPDGSIYPCGALKIKLGSIDDLNLVFQSGPYHDLVNRTAGNIKPCQGCKIEAFCAGGCAADALAVNGTLNASAANCDLEKAVFKQLVKKQLLVRA